MVTEVDKGVNVSPVPEVVTVHLERHNHSIIIINIIYVGSWYLAPFLTLIPSIPPNTPNVPLIYPLNISAALPGTPLPSGPQHTRLAYRDKPVSYHQGKRL